MNFYDSLTYVWNFGRIYGFNYFTNQQNELKVTKTSFITSLIPGTCFVLLTLYGNYVLTPEGNELYGIDIVFLVIQQIGIVLQFLNCAMGFIMSFIHRKGVIKFYESIYEVDDILMNKLKINMNYREMKFISSRRLFTTHFGICIISGIIDYVYASNKSYIPIMLVYNYSAGSGLMSSLEYNNCTKILKYRFNLLNDLLISKSQFINPNDLEVMVKCHFTLNGLIHYLNEIYGLRQLCTITNDFVIIVVNIYVFFLSIDSGWNDFDHIKFLFGAVMLPPLITKMYFTVTNCQEVLSNKKYFGKLLKKLNDEKITIEGSALVILTVFEF